MSRKGTIRIFSDFDGTVAVEDVGNRFFELFSGKEMWEDNALYCEGAISAQELYTRNAQRITGISQKAVDEFCSGFEIDPGFSAFVRWCSEAGYPLTILSDGFDIYIEPILRRYALDVPVRYNKMTINGDGSCAPFFPYADVECRSSANCKRNHVLTESADEDYIVYIGDGISDYDSVLYADLVFAKGSLETRCQMENVSFRRFFTFHDLRTTLERLVRERGLRRNRQAALRRKTAWMSG